MFQQSVLSGILMLAGIFAGSPDRSIVALGAVAALVAASTVALLRGMNGTRDGLQGFNAVLAGCAVFTFLSAGWATWGLVVVAALLTLPLKTLLDKLLSSTNQSSYTLPFIVATWAVLLLAGTGIIHPYVPEAIEQQPELTTVNIIIGWLKGISQVFLIDSWIGAVLILAGLAVSSWRVAILALVGSAAGMILAAIFGCQQAEILGGLWGFSPVLTAIAIGSARLKGHMPSAQLLHYAILALSLTLTVLLQLCLTPLLAAVGLPILTLPFCLATIITKVLHY